MANLKTVLAALCIASSPLAYSHAVAADKSNLRKSIAKDYKTNLKDLFIHFHQNPELPLREFKTSERLGQELSDLGYDVTTGVGGTGVVAVLKNGSGPTVLVRADMDGLPVKEASGLSYASTATQIDRDGKEKPVMHACGHDVHITSLVGTARQMMARKKDWSGTLVLIGQPAEEIISGARLMIEDGLYERFPKPDYALAFHVSAGMPEGRIQVPLEAVASSSDSIDIIVHGVGAHGASPHKGIDPILVGSQIVVALQSIVSRNIAPLEPGVITVGAFHSGIKHNIISDRAELQLTVRSDNAEIREQLLDSIDRVAKGVAIAMGVPDDKMPEVIRSSQSTPPTINDPDTAQRIRDVLTSAMGEETLIEIPRQGMGAEDFAYFVDPKHGVKGVYFSVGGTPVDQVKTAPSHHSPLFWVEPEPSIKNGTEAMVLGAMALFNGK